MPKMNKLALKQKITELRHHRFTQPALFIIVFAVVGGGITVLFTQAATPTASFEAESGTITAPASVATDSEASGGKFVQFSTPGSTGSGAKLLWSDEFNGSAGSDVNSADWDTQVGGPTNLGRVEYLTPGTHNKQMDGNGNLVVTARQESYGGRGYTSSRIEGKRPFTTGYAEFRVKVPTWQGTCPAVWFYGAAGGSYPTTGNYSAANDYIEIDNLELETTSDPNRVRQTIHGDQANHDANNLWQLGWSNNTVDTSPLRPGDGWHTYGVYVSPSDHSVTFYSDGVQKAHYTQSQAVSNFGSGTQWPYGTRPMIPIIEIELCGYSRFNGPGQPLDPSRTSDTLQADWYRMYDKVPF
jgi:beta-glucanase (GH16 family)